MINFEYLTSSRCLHLQPIQLFIRRCEAHWKRLLLEIMFMAMWGGMWESSRTPCCAADTFVEAKYRTKSAEIPSERDPCRVKLVLNVNMCRLWAHLNFIIFFFYFYFITSVKFSGNFRAFRCFCGLSAIQQIKRAKIPIFELKVVGGKMQINFTLAQYVSYLRNESTWFLASNTSIRSSSDFFLSLCCLTTINYEYECVQKK